MLSDDILLYVDTPPSDPACVAQLLSYVDANGPLYVPTDAGEVCVFYRDGEFVGKVTGKDASVVPSFFAPTAPRRTPPIPPY